MTLPREVLGDRVGEAWGVLQHLLNLRRSQKVRTSRLIPDALRQPLDESRRLIKGGMCLLLLSARLIQRSQRRLDLPAFGWQIEVSRQLSGLVPVVDGLLAVPIPCFQHFPRAQAAHA